MKGLSVVVTAVIFIVVAAGPVVSRIFRTFDQATASVCATCG